MKLFEKLLALYKNNTLSVTVGFIIIVMLLLAFQGLDVVDEGWYMTFYQQFYNDPQTVEYNFVFYLTGIFGGLWYQLFPQGGILSFRILAALCIISTFVIAFNILKNYIPKKYAIVGLLMVLFVTDFGYVAFYYNQLSGFFGVLIIFFLLKGLNKYYFLPLFIAGALTAINVFSRLPNITLFVFSLVFPLQMLWSKTVTHKDWLKQVFVYFFGGIIGFVIMYLILVTSGHIAIMEKALLGIISKGQNEGSNHNVFKLLVVYKQDYLLIIKSLIKILLAVSFLWFTKKHFYRYRITKYIWHILGLIFFIIIFNKDTIYAIYGLSLIATIGLLVVKSKKDSKIKNAILLALLMMVFLPLGSDGGIHNVGYMCIWLAFPFFIYMVRHTEEFVFTWKFQNTNHLIAINKKLITKLLFLLISGYFILKVYHLSSTTYFDPGSRFNKTFVVNTPLANGIYTTKERAEIINSVLSALQKHVKKDDYLLAYDKIPMLNFLTETKPYMYNSWVWVYDDIMFKKQLKRAEKEIEILPIVVQQKFETIGEFSEPTLDYMSEDKEENYRYNRARVSAMNDFLRRNNYQIVWSNTHFNIYKPIKIN